MAETQVDRSAADWKQQGDDLQRGGRLEAAVEAYNRALELDPHFIRVLNNGAAALGHMGRNEEAAAWFRRALALEPADAGVLANFGRLLLKLQYYDEMIATADTALLIDPRSIQAVLNKSAATGMLGRPDESLHWANQILRFEPDNAQALSQKAATLCQLGRPAEAVETYRALLHLQPDEKNLAACGECLLELGRDAEALPYLASLTEMCPDNSAYHNNYALALLNLEKPESALPVIEQAAILAPDSIDIAVTRGSILNRLWRFEDALMVSEHILDLEPENMRGVMVRSLALMGLERFEACLQEIEKNLRHAGEFEADFYLNASAVYQRLGNLETALDNCRLAIVARPDFVEAHHAYGTLLLLFGRYGEGWPEHEWRLKKPSLTRALTFSQPWWNGNRFIASEDALLIISEQGFGDVLQFSRFAMLLAEKGYRVIFEVYPELFSLFATGFKHDRLTVVPRVDSRTAIYQDMPFVAYIGVLSLPYLLETTVSTIPANVPYLAPPPGRVDYWRQRIASTGNLKVGLVWGGNLKPDASRSIPAEIIAPLLAREGVDFYSIRKGKWDMSAFPPNSITDYGERIGDFADTAAIIQNLDLVITIDTSMAHLAGALGCPCWVMITKVPDWRWHLEGDSSPWYPTLRLFRQSRRGNWSDVVANVAKALGALVSSRGPVSPHG